MGVGQSNSVSNLYPGTYTLDFLNEVATPAEILAGNSAAILTNSPAGAILRGQKPQQRAACSAASATDNVLRSVRPRPPQGAAAAGRGRGVRREVPAAEAEAALGTLYGDTPAAELLANLDEPPAFYQNPNGGQFGGTDTSAILNASDTPPFLDNAGNIFGGPCSQIVNKRINQLNGFNYAVNVDLYSDPTVAGNPNKPYIPNNFKFQYGPALMHPWGRRCMNQSQFTATGTIPYTSNPNTGNATMFPSPYPVVSTGYYPQTQGLALYVNGAVGRTIYLVRRPQPYVFHLPNQFRKDGKDPLTGYTTPQGADINEKYIVNQGGVYFTTDPAGGGAWNDINYVNGLPVPVPVFAQAYVSAGGFVSVIVDDTWPDALFYQSTLGPFMGGLVIVTGSYRRG